MDPNNENNNVAMGNGAPTIGPDQPPVANNNPVSSGAESVPSSPAQPPVASPSPIQSSATPPSPAQPPVASPSPIQSLATPSVESAKKNKTGLWIGIGAGAVAVIGIVLAAILIPQLTGPNYEEMYKSADSLYNSLSGYFGGACQNVAIRFSDTYSTSPETYKKYIENCRTDANELSDAIKTFETESGVTKDSEINDLFSKFKAVYEVNAPGLDKLEDTLKVYGAYHDFAVAMKDFNYYDSEKLIPVDEFSKITEYLTGSGSAVLKSFGDELNRRYGVLYDAAQEYRNTSISDYEAYNSAWEKFRDAEDDFSDHLFDGPSVIRDSDMYLANTADHGNGSVFDTYFDMQKAISKKKK